MIQCNISAMLLWLLDECNARNSSDMTCMQNIIIVYFQRMKILHFKMRFHDDKNNGKSTANAEKTNRLGEKTTSRQKRQEINNNKNNSNDPNQQFKKCNKNVEQCWNWRAYLWKPFCAQLTTKSNLAGIRIICCSFGSTASGVCVCVCVCAMCEWCACACWWNIHLWTCNSNWQSSRNSSSRIESTRQQFSRAISKKYIHSSCPDIWDFHTKSINFWIN